MHPDVRSPRRGPLLAAPVVLLLATALGVAPVLAGQDWSFKISPSSIVAGVEADILVTVTNTSSNASDGDRIGCVTVTAPAGLTVVSARIASATGGHAWRAATSAGVAGSVTATALSDASRLVGAQASDSVVIRIRVMGSTAGNKSVEGVVANGIDCSDSIGQQLARGISVTPAGPTPRPTSTPTPRPTSTPAPTPGPTPAPTPRPTPLPTARPTPAPTPRPTPLPTPTPTAKPTPTPTAKPVPTAMPTPAPTTPSTPTPAAPSTATPPPAPSISPGPSSPGPSPSATPSAPSAATAAPVDRPAPSPPVSGVATGSRSPGFVTGRADSRGAINIEGVAVGFTGELLAWVVPGLLMSVPGLLVLLAVLIQLSVGAAWLPVVRRRLGGFGFGRDRGPSGRG